MIQSNNMTDNNSDTETESTEEEVEPKLKYIRIENDLKTILNKDAVSCVAVHPRFLFFGTFFGGVFLLDHQGNFIKSPLNQKQEQQHFSHTIAVNHISVDAKGEYVATCSDDGWVNILGLYNQDNDQRLEIGKSVKSIALDSDIKSGSPKRFLVGDNKLTLYEKSFLKTLKSTVLSESEGFVSAIAWNGQFIAWASSLGVRVFDLSDKCSLGLIKWEEPKGSKLENFRCNLRWSTPTVLLIGWVDIIRICIIRKRNSVEVLTKNMPGYIVDPISTFQTDFYVCGLAPLETNQLVVLGYPKERDSQNNKALRPILCVLQYKTSDYTEICTDSLSLRGYQEYKVNDYHLDCIIEENRYFIVSPKDIVVASLYETNDRVQWLIEHKKFEQAMEVISANGGSLVNVARLYLDHLLSLKQFDEAAKLCLRVFGNNKLLWEEEVYKFVKVQQLRSVSAYLPRTNDCKLNPQVYEMVLFEYLKLDVNGFLNFIKDWPPILYNTSAVINAIRDNFNTKYTNELLEALAILYSHEKKYDSALKTYLKLQNKDVFDLIKTHNLYGVIHELIIPLIQLDEKRAISILIEKDKIPPEIVVQQLKDRQYYMYLYLDALDNVDNSGKYHWKLVNLYAKFAKDKLLPFLRRSNNYPIQEALDICKRELFYPEMVFLLERMGNTREALNIIIHKLGDIQKAINFCKDHDDSDLWNDLINESLEKPHIMTKLLDGIVGYVNPESLVNKIKLGQEIPGLKKSLIKMLTDYSLQVSIQDGCNEILVTDYFNLHEKLIRCQRRALTATNESICGLCRRGIILKEPIKSDVIIFNCRHFFHETCLPDKYDIESCSVCKSKK